jgi:hypothetical protein
MRLVTYIFIILLTIWIPVSGQNDLTKDFNDRLLKSIYPLLPSQVKFTKSFCEILGMLDEYIGRQIEFASDDIIESFYSTLNDNESAKHFRILIEDYEKELATSFHIRIQANNRFYSRSFCSIINCLYVSESNPSYQTLDKKYILNLSDDLKYAYLKGAYQRFGGGNEISIANGINKLKTIAMVMESLGVKNIKLYSSGPNTLPTDYILTFDSSPILRSQLGFRDSESRLNYYPDKRIVRFD